MTAEQIEAEKAGFQEEGEYALGCKRRAEDVTNKL